jgi:hypothetical protein
VVYAACYFKEGIVSFNNISIDYTGCVNQVDEGGFPERITVCYVFREIIPPKIFIGKRIFIPKRNLTFLLIVPV